MMGKGKFGICVFCDAQNDTVIQAICDTCRRAGKEKKRNELDVNNDGVVDDKDASIASKVLTSQRMAKKAKRK